MIVVEIVVVTMMTMTEEQGLGLGLRTVGCSNSPLPRNDLPSTLRP